METGDESKNILSIFAAPPGYVVIKADYCVPLDTLVEVEVVRVLSEICWGRRLWLGLPQDTSEVIIFPLLA